MPFETTKPAIAKYCSIQCSKAYKYSEQYMKRIPEDKQQCYLKEAHAILQGKNWKGKNKCTKLEGD